MTITPSDLRLGTYFMAVVIITAGLVLRSPATVAIGAAVLVWSS